jgi:hypothetical protein
MTTNTEQLIKQAVRELGIDIQPHERVVTMDRQPAGDHLVAFVDRHGEHTSILIADAMPYPQILDTIKKAWRA